MTGRGFVKLHRESFPAYCRTKQIRLEDRGVFEHLILEADWVTGIVEGFTLTHCSREIGLGTSSGRRTLTPFLRRLEAVGAIVYVPGMGNRPGRIAIVDYHHITRAPKGARTARGSDEPNRATSARETTARPVRAKHLPEGPADQHVCQSEEVALVDVQLASEPAGSPTPKDWADTELEVLLHPILDFCRRTGKRGVSRRAGVLAALAPYTRAQIEHAVTELMLELDGPVGGRIGKPVGVLTAAAQRGDVEYFPVAVAVAAPAPRPTSSFGRPLIDKSDLSERYGE